MFGVDFAWGDGPDGEADKDVASAIEFGVVKFAATVFEAADAGNAEDATIARGEVDAPLMGDGIVEAKGEEFEVAGGAEVYITGRFPLITEGRRTRICLEHSVTEDTDLASHLTT